MIFSTKNADHLYFLKKQKRKEIPYRFLVSVPELMYRESVRHQYASRHKRSRQTMYYWEQALA